jgi:hypothetical protein
MPRCGATRRDNVIGRPEGPRRLSGALPSGFHCVGSDVVGGMPLESELLTLHEDTRTVIDRLWQGDTGSEFHGAFTLCTVFRKHGVFHYTSFAFSGRRCNLLIFFLYMHVLYAPDAQIVPVSGIHLVCIPTVTALEVVDSFGRELSVRQWSRGGITRIYFLAPRLPSFPCGERTAAYPNITDNSHMVFDNLQDDNPPMQHHTTTVEQEDYLSRLTPRRYSRSLRSSKRHSRISPAFNEPALHWLI